MWMMPLHLHVNQKSDYDDDDYDIRVGTHKMSVRIVNRKDPDLKKQSDLGLS